nr:MAG TPA: hypothetical protein [Caudoviricetes sp.]
MRRNIPAPTLGSTRTFFLTSFFNFFFLPSM